MATPITSVSGIGGQTAEILIENGFADAETLAAAKEEDLLKISGFGPSRAKKFIDAAQVLVGAGTSSSDVAESSQETSVAKGVREPSIEPTEKEEVSVGPKVCTQKLCKNKKKKVKPSKSRKKKKKSSRKKKSR